MINNNPYSQPDRPQHRLSQGFQKNAYRAEQKSQNTNVNSIMKKSAIILGHQGLSGSRIQNSLLNFSHSPRQQPYGNFSLPRNSNPNPSNGSNQQIRVSSNPIPNTSSILNTGPNTNSFTHSQMNAYNSLMSSQISTNGGGQLHQKQQNHFQIRGNYKLELKIHNLEQRVTMIDAKLAQHQLRLSKPDQQIQLQEIKNLLNEFREIRRISEQDDIKILQFSNELMLLKQELKEISSKGEYSINQKLQNFENYVLKTFVINEKDIYDKISNVEKLAKAWQKPFDQFKQKLSHFQKQGQISKQNQTQVKSKLKQLEQNILKKKMQESLKKSLLKSESTIVLKYIENFRIKWGQKNIERDINISETMYYIDNEGSLLDEQNRFILDNRGNKIRLQEKHINLLKMHDVLK